MSKVTFRINDFLIPLLPSEIKVTGGDYKHETYDVIGIGEVTKMTKIQNPSIVSFDSMFPIQRYSFLQGEYHHPSWYIIELNKLQKSQKPIEIQLKGTAMAFTMKCTIQSFTQTIKNKNDVYYSITFKSVKTQQIKLVALPSDEAETKLQQDNLFDEFINNNLNKTETPQDEDGFVEETFYGDEAETFIRKHKLKENCKQEILTYNEKANWKEFQVGDKIKIPKTLLKEE